MVQDLSRKEEQRGFRQAFMWGLGIAAVVAVVAIAGPLLTDYFFVSDKAGMEEATKTPAEAAEEAASVPVTVAVIGIVNSSEYGPYLTDGQGRAIYLFEGDEQGGAEGSAVSTCYEDCAKAWPPVTTTDRPRLVGQVDESLVGTTERRDGTEQVTYNGWPLYHFAKDFGPRETTGQDIEDFGAEWYLVTPEGEKVAHRTENTG